MTIRSMVKADGEAVMQMMRTFYASPAVHTNGSEEIFKADVEACVTNSPYLEGYIMEEDGNIAGYAMVAKSFSTEFGKPCIWIEDIYIQEPYRGTGIGSKVLTFIASKYPHAVIRLEVEEENRQAVHVYKKAGFESLPYTEMMKHSSFAPGGKY